jgi:hypothetical protein
MEVNMTNGNQSSAAQQALARAQAANRRSQEPPIGVVRAAATSSDPPLSHRCFYELADYVSCQPGVAFLFVGGPAEDEDDEEDNNVYGSLRLGVVLDGVERIVGESRVVNEQIIWPDAGDVAEVPEVRAGISSRVAQIRAAGHTHFALLSELPSETHPTIDYAGYDLLGAVTALARALGREVSDELVFLGFCWPPDNQPRREAG